MSLKERILPKPDGSGFVAPHQRKIPSIDDLKSHTSPKIDDPKSHSSPPDSSPSNNESALLDELDAHDMSNMDAEDLQGSTAPSFSTPKWKTVTSKSSKKKNRKNKSKNSAKAQPGGICAILSPTSYTQQGSSSSSSSDSKQSSSSSDDSSLTTSGKSKIQDFHEAKSP